MPLVHFSRRSRRAPAFVSKLEIDKRAPKPNWQNLAAEKGYRYYGRDPHSCTNVFLQCLRCSYLLYVHTHTLRAAQPDCTACYLADMASEAEAAGLTFLRPDPTDSHRGIYRAECGHNVVRQRVFVQQVGRGEDRVRCGICLETGYAELARDLGWTLLGAAPSRRAGYRNFRHACGHCQEITIGNLKTARCSCNGCAGNWSSDPSYVYLYRFDLPENLGSYLKIGMSRQPLARLRYQLDLSDDIAANLIDQIAMPSGATALREEKRLHKILRTDHPAWVVDRGELAWIAVVSEIYRIDALPRITEMMTDLRARSRS